MGPSFPSWLDVGYLFYCNTGHVLLRKKMRREETLAKCWLRKAWVKNGLSSVVPGGGASMAGWERGLVGGAVGEGPRWWSWERGVQSRTQRKKGAEC